MRQFFRTITSVALSLMLLAAIRNACVVFLGNGSTQYGELFNDEKSQFWNLSTERLLDEYKVSHQKAKRIAKGDDENACDANSADADPIAEWNARVSRTINEHSHRRDLIKAELCHRESITYLFRITIFWGVSGFSAMVLALSCHLCVLPDRRSFDIRLVGLLQGGLAAMAWAVAPTSAVMGLSQMNQFATLQAVFSAIAIGLIWAGLRPNGLIDSIE
jgi:hypothetical protein